MALPKIQYPVFELTIPSTGEVVVFRPFLVKEEKILLIAQESGEDREILLAMKQVINNCSTTDINIDSLLISDFEWLFLQLRARSINNVIDLTYIDREDGQEYKVSVDVYDIHVKHTDPRDNKIKVGDDVTVVMRYPQVAMLAKMKAFEDDAEVLNFFLKECIETVYDTENAYDMKENTDEEIQQWIDSLDVTSFEAMKDFIGSAPTIEHDISYTNSLGNKKDIKLTSLRDFFTLG